MQNVSRSFYEEGNRSVRRVGEATIGGAFTNYQVFDSLTGNVLLDVPFQSAPIPEIGVVGVTNECLLAIVRDRLQCFQDGNFPCSENAAALEALNTAIERLEARTLSRRLRGIEGKYAV